VHRTDINLTRLLVLQFIFLDGEQQFLDLDDKLNRYAKYAPNLWKDDVIIILLSTFKNARHETGSFKSMSNTANTVYYTKPSNVLSTFFTLSLLIEPYVLS